MGPFSLSYGPCGLWAVILPQFLSSRAKNSSPGFPLVLVFLPWGTNNTAALWPWGLGFATLAAKPESLPVSALNWNSKSLNSYGNFKWNSDSSDSTEWVKSSKTRAHSDGDSQAVFSFRFSCWSRTWSVCCWPCGPLAPTAPETSSGHLQQRKWHFPKRHAIAGILDTVLTWIYEPEQFNMWIDMSKAGKYGTNASIDRLTVQM